SFRASSKACSVPLPAKQSANPYLRLCSASLGCLGEPHHFRSKWGSGVDIDDNTALLDSATASYGDRASAPGELDGRDARLLHCSYFTSTVAPASVNFFLMFSASSLDTPSFTVLGAPSTRSLASFKPRLVTSRTALMTLILFAPTSLSTTANSVFSSTGAAPAAAPPPPATITGAAAAAETPRRSSSFLTNCAASSSDSPTICSSNCARSAIFSSPVFLILPCRDAACYVCRFRYP